MVRGLGQASRHAGCFTVHAGDGDQGDKLSAKFYDGTKFLDLGQPGELHSGISSSPDALDAPAWRTWSRGAWQAKLRRKAPGSWGERGAVLHQIAFEGQAAGHHVEDPPSARHCQEKRPWALTFVVHCHAPALQVSRRAPPP